MMPVSLSPTKRLAINRSSKSHNDTWPAVSLRSIRSAFLLCAVLFLSFYHLRQEVTSFHPFEQSKASVTPKDSPLSKLGFQGIDKLAVLGEDVSITPVRTLEMNNVVQLKQYLPRNDPVLPDYKPSSSRKVQVHIWTGSTHDLSAPTKFLVEGVERSQYLKLVHISFLEPHLWIQSLEVERDRDRKAPLIWIVDLMALGHECHALEKLLSHSLELNKKRKYKQRPRVLTIDFSGSPRTLHCPEFLKKLDQANHIPLRMAQRGIVHNRIWNMTKNWVESGHIEPNPGKNHLSAGNLLYSPLPVREIVVSQIFKLVDAQRKERSLDKLRPVDYRRSNDVAFFWRKGDNAHFGNLRQLVAQTIVSLQGVEVGARKLRTLIRYVGDAELMGTTTVVFSRYVKEMLGAKVVVVAQRDEWEDHYRLMDSLASGALVFSDSMVGVPEGLEHQKNIIFYNSAESLREQLLFYLDPANEALRLAIAKRGWELLMGQHRCWHRVEELVFGSAKTAVGAAYDDPPNRETRGKQKARGKKASISIEVPREQVIEDIEEVSR